MSGLSGLKDGQAGAFGVVPAEGVDVGAGAFPAQPPERTDTNTAVSPEDGPETPAAEAATQGARAQNTDATRNRILEAGMYCFAKDGYQGATTRKIAARSGVTLPVIAYHFGNKEGLHRACVEAIVDGYRTHMLPLVTGAHAAVSSGQLGADQARLLLDQILGALVRAIGAAPEERLATDFVMHELAEQGHGYAYLYKELWKPGIYLTADLVAIIRGRARANADDRAMALLLLSSLTAMTTQAPISLPVMGWQAFEDSQQKLILRQLQILLDGLASD